MIFELRTLELSTFEAEQLAWKLEIIGATYSEVERDNAKRDKDDQELQHRMRG